jgi:hypothetical protein
MTAIPRSYRAVDGKGHTIRELLAGHEYSLECYQREYKWEHKQVAELIDDLAGRFLESHEKGVLARRLRERAYDHNSGFRRYIERSGLSFRAHPEFKKADLDARQQLYQTPAEQIWSSDRLARELTP